MKLLIITKSDQHEQGAWTQQRYQQKIATLFHAPLLYRLCWSVGFPYAIISIYYFQRLHVTFNYSTRTISISTFFSFHIGLKTMFEF